MYNTSLQKKATQNGLYLFCFALLNTTERTDYIDEGSLMAIQRGPMEALRPRVRVLAKACSLKSARSSASERFP